MVNSVLENKDAFSEKLFEVMKQINPGIPIWNCMNSDMGCLN
jgi:hypothetical protein